MAPISAARASAFAAVATRDADLGEGAHAGHRLRVGAGLDAGAEDRERRRVLAGQEARRERRAGGGAQGGDGLPVQERRRLAPSRGRRRR